MRLKLILLLCCFIRASNAVSESAENLESSGTEPEPSKSMNNGIEDVVDKSYKKERSSAQPVDYEETITFENITIRVQNYITTLYFDEEVVKFQEAHEYCIIDEGGDNLSVKRGSHLKTALDYLKSIIENPDVQLKKLVIGVKMKKSSASEKMKVKNSLNQIESLFSSLEYPLQVKTVVLDSSHVELFQLILPHLEAGFLEKISMICDYIDRETMTPIVELDQWKMAKTFWLTAPDIPINEWGIPIPWDLPIDWFFHFSKFHIPFDYLSRQVLVKIRDTLLNSDNFEYFYLAVSEEPDVDKMAKIFGLRMSLHDPCPFVRYYRLPESDEVFSFKIGYHFFRIQRKH